LIVMLSSRITPRIIRSASVLLGSDFSRVKSSCFAIARHQELSPTKSHKGSRRESRIEDRRSRAARRTACDLQSSTSILLPLRAYSCDFVGSFFREKRRSDERTSLFAPP